MNEDNEIIPRTRTHKNEKTKLKDLGSLNKTTDQYSKEELEKILNNIPRTNEQKKLENDQWTWENKIWLILACIIIIIILILGAYILWSSDNVDSDLRDFESKNKNPPGTNTNNIPLKYLEKYSIQQAQQQEQQQLQMQQQVKQQQVQNTKSSYQPQPAQNTNSNKLKFNEQKSVLEPKDLRPILANQNFNNIKKKMMKLRNISIVQLNNNEPHKILNPKSENIITQVPNETIDNPTVLEVSADNKNDDQFVKAKLEVLDENEDTCSATNFEDSKSRGSAENVSESHGSTFKFQNELDNDIQQAVDTTSMFS